MIRAGHFLKMIYPTLSKGDGAEADFILLTTRMTSLIEKGLQSISTSGLEGGGIHSGWTKVRGLDWYSLREILACCGIRKSRDYLLSAAI